MITHLPENLDSLVNRKVLTLMGNPMEEPPMIVCAEGAEAVWAYLKERRNMKTMATKVKSAKILYNIFTVAWSGISVKLQIYEAALYTSIP